MATTSYTSLDTQSSGTDLEEVNTEDEMNTDTSKWSEKEKKKLQHMTEFHKNIKECLAIRLHFVLSLKRELCL